VSKYPEDFPELHPTQEARMQFVFSCIRHDILEAIEEFGYAPVYFGVACECFPDAVDPWEGNDY